MMLKSVRVLSAAAILAMASATQVMAGGFVLLLGNPQASPAARTLNAAVTAKAVGCGDATKATVTGVAIGMVDGRRQTIPLKVSALPEVGMFAVSRQWPAEGRWVLQLTASEGGRTTTTIARVTPDGVDHNGAKVHASESDVAGMLAAAPVLQARK